MLSRLVGGVVGGVYAIFLVLTYRELSKVWSYMGFWYQPQPLDVTLTTVFASALLVMLLPARDWTIVGFSKWVLCFLLFIPAIVIPTQQGILPTQVLVAETLLIWVCSALFILLLRDGKPLPVIALREITLWQVVIGLWLVGHLTMVIVFRNSMSLAGLAQVYEQRSAAGEVAGAGTGYIMGMLSGAVNPFLLAVGLSRRRLLFIVLALIGQVIIYSTLAGKVVLGSTLLTVGTFFAFRHGKVAFGRIYAGVLAFAVMGPVVSAPRAAASVVTDLSDLIYMRILVLPGVLVGAYTEFFQRYPVTHLSHSLVGRLFLPYPYGEESVGQVIGRYVTPTAAASVNNYNANFIAADGIAGFGIWGIPLVYGLAAAWLWFASKAVGDQNRPLVCAAMTPFVVALADASLFTALLTGGGALLCVLLFLYRCANVTSARERLRGLPAANVQA